jgi:guanosine-3',5'-bis(diphosphate) 3'-pyrophosphohydrolase
VIVAALLHDVLEDTTVTRAEVAEVAGEVALGIVEALTEDGSLVWEERKEAYVRRVRDASEAVWMVSVADKIHNAETLLEHLARVGDEGWSVFNRGKEKKIWFEELLYSDLRTVWQHPLLDRYGQLIEKLKVA